MRLSPCSVRDPLFLILLAASAASTSAAQEPVLREGDLIGPHPVNHIRTAHVTNAGTWDAVASVSAPAFPVLAEDGVQILRQGDPVPAVGARVSELQAVTGAGANRTVVALLGSFNPPRDHSLHALLRGDQVFLLASEPTDVDGLPPTTICRRIDAVTANESDTVLAIARIDDGLRSALMRFEFDPDGTNRVRRKLVTNGDVLPDGSIVTSLPLAQGIALNEAGQWLLRVQTDQGLRLLSGEGILAANGDAAPLPGHTITKLIFGYDRDDFGGLAFGAEIDGDPARNQVLIQNGLVRARRGDLLPTNPPLVLDGIGDVRSAGPGHVFWHARVPGGADREGVLLRDGTPILVSGQSFIDGERVLGFASPFHAFEPSASGRFWIAGVELETSGETLVLADFGASRPILGCVPNAGTLRHTDGLVQVGRTVRLVLDGPAPLGSLATLHLSAGSPANPCGLPSPFGEVLIDPLQRLGDLTAGVFAGAQVTKDVRIPVDASLVDRTFFVQGSFRGPGVLLTNGLAFEIGAP